jgi:hypothetical protein
MDVKWIAYVSDSDIGPRWPREITPPSFPDGDYTAKWIASGLRRLTPVELRPLLRVLDAWVGHALACPVALDQGQSSGVAARPTDTGFSSIYAAIRWSSFCDLTQ